MRKQAVLTLLLILGLLIPQIAFGYSVPGGQLQTPKPVVPGDVVNINPPEDPPEDPPVTFDQSLPCGGQVLIEIDGTNQFASTIIADKLDHYHIYGVENVAKNRYEICFDIQNEHASIPSTLLVQPDPAADQTRGLAVYDLRVKPGEGLSAGDPVVLVNFQVGKVEFIRLSMSNVMDGLFVNETQVEITDSTITGEGSGNCLELNGANDSVIKSSTISGCYIGLLIDNSNDLVIGAETAEDFYQADGATLKDANLITQNEQFGIHLIDGHRNQFGYNLNHTNSGAAIVIEEGMNEDIKVPVPTRRPVKNGYTVMHCEYDNDNKPTRYFLKFPGLEGSIQLYQAQDLVWQAERFITSCTLNGNGECDLVNLPTWAQLHPDKCGIDAEEFYATAIHTNLNSSSSMLMVKESLIGIVVIFAESGGVDVPTAPASDDEADITSGSQLSAEGGATEIAAVAAVGAKGGCMGGGASLLPNDISSTYAPHLGAWWIIFSIAFLASMRVVKVRRRRSSRIHKNKRG